MLSHWQNWSKCTNFWPTQHVYQTGMISDPKNDLLKQMSGSSQTSWASENREPEMVQLGIHRSIGPLPLSHLQEVDIPRHFTKEHDQPDGIWGKNHRIWGTKTHRIWMDLGVPNLETVPFVWCPCWLSLHLWPSSLHVSPLLGPKISGFPHLSLRKKLKTDTLNG